MRVDLFDYHLDPARIADAPSGDPLAARLMDLTRDGPPIFRQVRDLPELIPHGSLVVVNDTRVLHARLLGRKRGSGGKVEILLVRRLDVESASVERWSALGKASKGLWPGMVAECGELEVEILARDEARGGTLEARLRAREGDVSSAIERSGHVPLPPYIKRPDGPADRERYQTIFAREPGAVAAPTAGLHLTRDLCERLIGERRCVIAPVTLHVGLGTFAPVTVDDLDDHPMHAELYDIPISTADAVVAARAREAPIVAIGTTVVRALESAADTTRPGHVRGGPGETRLLIQPGYTFKVVDRLFTNFHLPRSTLLALVSAFAGTRRVLDAYAEAQAQGCRFFSYGDAMLLSPGPDARSPPG